MSELKCEHKRRVGEQICCMRLSEYYDRVCIVSESDCDKCNSSDLAYISEIAIESEGRNDDERKPD